MQLSLSNPSTSTLIQSGIITGQKLKVDEKSTLPRYNCRTIPYSSVLVIWINGGGFINVISTSSSLQLGHFGFVELPLPPLVPFTDFLLLSSSFDLQRFGSSLNVILRGLQLQ